MDKKDKRSTYTIIGIAPEKIQQLFCKLKQSFNLPFGDSKIASKFILKDIAHFAIKRSFCLKQGITEEDLVKKVEKMKFNKKIQIVCKKSEFFLDTNLGDILYAEIASNNELLNLHKEIKQEIDSIVDTKRIEMEGEGCKPHISVVYDISKEKEEDVMQELDTNILPFHFYLDNIILLRDIDSSKDLREIVYTYNLL